MEPNQASSRIVIIDALRGFALAGVALVHITEQYIAGPPPPEFMEGVNSLPDQIVQGLIQFFFVGKFFALFSILFGLSFAIQMESAAKRDSDFSLRFLWRAVLLFGIGYVHQLFYRGDILTIYAMLAPFLIPFHKVNSKWVLITAAIFFFSIPRLLAYALFGAEPLFGLPAEMNNPIEAAYIESIRSGSLSEVFGQNAIYGMKTKMDFQLRYFGRFYYTFGYFLLGLWIGKIGLFQQLKDYLPKIGKATAWAGAAFIVSIMITIGFFSTVPQPVDFSKWQHIIAFNFSDWINLSFTMIIICAFILLYQKKWWHKRLAFFAPYGRMALTNYILQALIGTFLLFGWGLGFFGQIRTLYLFLIAIGLIGIQTILSKYWLQHFNYGPLEWLWRSGTYLKWQPFRKDRLAKQEVS